MAMVKISKGKTVLFVPLGAFKEVYKKNGWRICPSNDSSIQPKNSLVVTSEENNKGNGEEGSQEPEDPQTGLENPEEEATKPLSDMGLEELKEYANQLGVDIEGLDSKKEIKRAIRAKMEE